MGPCLAGRARARGYPAAGLEFGPADEVACTCGKHEEREVAAKSRERGLSVAEDAMGYTDDRRSDLEEGFCREAQPVANEDSADEELLRGNAAGLILPIQRWQVVAQC